MVLGGQGVDSVSTGPWSPSQDGSGGAQGPGARAALPGGMGQGWCRHSPLGMSIQAGAGALVQSRLLLPCPAPAPPPQRCPRPLPPAPQTHGPRGFPAGHLGAAAVHTPETHLQSLVPVPGPRALRPQFSRSPRPRGALPPRRGREAAEGPGGGGGAGRASSALGRASASPPSLFSPESAVPPNAFGKAPPNAQSGPLRLPPAASESALWGPSASPGLSWGDWGAGGAAGRENSEKRRDVKSQPGARGAPPQTLWRSRGGKAPTPRGNRGLLPAAPSG